jgi:hypothetical protein
MKDKTIATMINTYDECSYEDKFSEQEEVD